MKDNIIDITFYKPHVVSEVICIRCMRRWIAVRPEDLALKDIECDNCGKGFVIETGEVMEDDY